MKPGDLIEIFRTGYEHWAVYVGDGNVVHLTGPSLSAGVVSHLVVGFPVVVKKEKLSDVVGNNRYRVNNKYDSKYPVRDPKDIVYRANRRVGQKKTYKVFTNNCEHFATSLRYNMPESDQVSNIFADLEIFLENPVSGSDSDSCVLLNDDKVHPTLCSRVVWGLELPEFHWQFN
ncbi:phospholipase A and acyltransferase 3-like [Erythrolamprus reginae]|uniref:phospholipase A and acyltransferase 3-like n=1 Tax=Erythrolamprus reginae TaxID=121349 RepID=UPI00396C3C6F